MELQDFDFKKVYWLQQQLALSSLSAITDIHIEKKWIFLCVEFKKCKCNLEFSKNSVAWYDTNFLRVAFFFKIEMHFTIKYITK